MGGFAWVTLATNDSYSLGALVLAHSLRKSNTAHKLAVLITPAVSQPMREQLASVFDVIKVVDVVDSKDQAHLALMKRPELGVTFTKIHCWTLTEFDKCVFLDADTLVVRNCDELFEREEFSAAPDASWPDCFNSGVFVYKPSVETFSKLLQFAVEKGSFDGGDQGLLNEYFSGWATEDIKKHLPFVYNLTSIAVYSYIPAFKQYGSNTRIVHFIGTGKPWLQQLDPATRTITPNAGSEHLTPLLQKWWDLFCEKVHPQLNKELPGIAGAIAKLRLDTGNEMESSGDSKSSAHEDYLRRQNWETGNIDYMGRDSFDNIWSKICHTLDQKVPEEMRKNLGALKSCSDVLAKVEPSKNQSGDVKNGSEVLANSTQQPVNTPTPCQAPPAQNKTKVAEQVQTPLDETPKSQDKKSEIEPVSPGALVQTPSQNVSPPPAATVVTSSADSKLPNQSPAQLPVSPVAQPQQELPSPDVKPNQTAEKALEKPPAACDQKSVPTGVAPNVILSAAPAAEAQEQVKPPHLSAIAPTQVVRITETPPTPIEKDVELNEFVEKQADVPKSEVEQPPLDQINQNTVPESPNQGTAMVPYCDVFQSIKCAQAPETQHSQHKRNVEEIIKHQGEAKSAQFPPIPLPQSPTEEKPEVSLSDSQHAPCNTVTPEAERALTEGQEMKTSGSGSLKDEGKAKKGMISKILEIVGVTPKQGEEATSSVFYDGENGAPKGDQQNLEKMLEKQVEQQAKEPAQAAAEGTPQEGDSVNAKVDTGNKANTVTEKESGNNNQRNHKNKRNKGKSPKPPTEKDDESNKKKQQEMQKKNEPSSKGSAPPPPANKDKSPKDKDENAENKPDENKSVVAQEGDTAVGGAMQATAGKEGRRKSPSPKLSLQGCGESTDKGSPLLGVDNTILETPPVTNQNFSKAETPEGKMLAGKVMAEIDQILDKAKTVVESKMEDRKSAEKQVAGEVPEAEAADEVNALKLITDDDKKEGPRATQPDAKGSKQSKLPKPQQESKGGKRGPQKQPPPPSAPSGAVEIEELKVTSEEDRKKHKSQPAPNSKLSDQILKAIPPPRRKAISDSKPEAGAIPKKPSGEAGAEPAKAGGKQGGGKSDPVPPPRNRSKPPHEAPPKGKTKK